MDRSPWAAFFCGVAILAVNSGCLFMQHTTRVTRKNEKPRAITFESPQAKGIFNAKLAEAKNEVKSNTTNPRFVAIPFLLFYSCTDTVSDNGIYNDQVALCDLNGDGVITLDEATTYGSKVDELIAKHNAEKAKIEAQIANSLPPNARQNSEPSNVQPASYPVQPTSVQQSLEANHPQAPLPPGSYR
jgi:hypothetical protein